MWLRRRCQPVRRRPAYRRLLHGDGPQQVLHGPVEEVKDRRAAGAQKLHGVGNVGRHAGGQGGFVDVEHGAVGVGGDAQLRIADTQHAVGAGIEPHHQRHALGGKLRLPLHQDVRAQIFPDALPGSVHALLVVDDAEGGAPHGVDGIGAAVEPGAGLQNFQEPLPDCHAGGLLAEEAAVAGEIQRGGDDVPGGPVLHLADGQRGGSLGLTSCIQMDWRSA